MEEGLPVSPLILGIDGGGSKTIALLANLQGEILGRGLGGPSNYHSLGVEPAQAAILQAIQAAFAAAHLPPSPAQAACLGLAGVDRPQDQSIFAAWAADHLPATAIAIVNDAQLVLAAGTPDNWGIALLSGTGSIAYGRDPMGHTARAGGWGYLLGDQGSGYAIGLAALRAVARAADGAGPSTRLTAAILHYWSLDSPQALIGQVYQPPIATTAIAALAEQVISVASEGDAVAQAIVQQAGADLTAFADAVVQRLNLSRPVPCALAGSILVKTDLVCAHFLAAAAERGLQLGPVTCVVEPAQGALRLAQNLIDQP